MRFKRWESKEFSILWDRYKIVLWLKGWKETNHLIVGFGDKDGGFGISENIDVDVKSVVLKIYDKCKTLQEHWHISICLSN